MTTKTSYVIAFLLGVAMVFLGARFLSTLKAAFANPVKSLKIANEVMAYLSKLNNVIN